MMLWLETREKTSFLILSSLMIIKCIMLKPKMDWLLNIPIWSLLGICYDSGEGA